MNGLGELLNAGKARVVERLALKDAKPYLYLVEPACAGGGEMKGDIGVRAEPLLILFVSA